ncbi:MAG: hypothetical protein JST10_12005 [Bacteroidetes bacterium]|nr:hypothetical protein [Bacteroidota bacterium]
MTQPKKLIEVAMPIKEISAESVRDKSIRHGHIVISTYDRFEGYCK